MALVTAAFVSVGVLAGGVAEAEVPITTPTNVTVQGTAGALAFHATSTAAMVQFQVDSEPALAPVAVAGDGIATAEWISWGYANGSHNVTAADCSDALSCGTPSAATPFELSNSQPVVTSPAAGSSVRGGFTINATAAGGALRFFVDDVLVGADSSSPYSFDYRGAALSEGNHTIGVIQCSIDLTRCDGPASALIGVHATVLHPHITRVAPNPFSPNSDGVRDTTNVTYYLAESQTVHVAIVNANSTVIRTANLNTVGAGSHVVTWNGRRQDGLRAANGTYTIRLNTSKTINGVAVPGITSARVRLDTIAPGLSSISGGGATFYPYPDGFRDVFTPRVTLNENAKLRLIIFNSSGAKVRTISASKSAGRVSLTWNGRNGAGTRVPAGTYRWTYSATDAAGNNRTSSRRAVTVSGKRLIARSTTITKDGDAFTSVQTSAQYCTQYSQAASFFPEGVWLDNLCDPYYGLELIQARYTFTVPSAASYGTISLRTYGNTLTTPTEIYGVYFSTSGSPTVKIATANTFGDHWETFSGVSGTSRVDSNDHVHVAVGVDNYWNDGYDDSDWDIGLVRLKVNYYVLG